MGVGWPHRLACVTAGATVGLIVAGGLVTNTGAALAVPDWPTTFGHNPFLFPWSGMVGGVLVEHGHRLLGSLIGLLTVGLVVALGFGDPRRWVRGLVLGLVHGCLAQLFFALLVGIAVVTGRAWRTPAVVPAGVQRLAAPGRWAAVVVYGQIVLGAFTTHGTAVWWHVAGAGITTVVLVGVALAVLRVAPEDPVLVRLARVLTVLLLLQLLLGVGAFTVRFTSVGVPGGQLAVIALPVLHRAVGALLFGSAVALALQLGRRRALGAERPAAGRVLVRTEAVA